MSEAVCTQCAGPVIRYKDCVGANRFHYHRSNREIVTARFREVLAAALRLPRKRRPTQPTAASKTRRIETKKRRGQIKQLRRSLDE